MIDKYAVMGNPIAHSKSPEIHAAFAAQTGEDLSYTRLLVEIPRFATEVQSFFAEGGKGLNITVPFKQAAFDLADQRSDRADLAGSVNTLMRLDDNQIYGDNTDGVGITRDICTNAGIGLAGKRILMLGAGGAVRGALTALLDQNPARLVIANRTLSKAQELVKLFQSRGNICCLQFNELKTEQFDLIINGTAAGLKDAVPEVPEAVLANGPICYDMIYGAQTTSFNRWAAGRGASQTFDGLGMLVEQAAESFRVWRSIHPATQPVIAMLRAGLS